MLSGAFWLFLEKGSSQGVAFVVFAIIARLVGPEEYGLIALCNIFFSLAVNAINGLVDAVVSMRLRDETKLSTLFWIVLTFGILLTGALYYLATPFASLMGAARLIPLLRAFAILPTLLALAAIPTALILAAMDFRIFTLRTLAASLISGVVGVSMAYHGYGAFALIYQQIAYYVVVNVILWWRCHWRPQLTFQRAGMREILRLGSNQAGSMLIGFLDQQAPRFIMGLFAGPLAVGQYAFVVRISGAVIDTFVQPLLTLVYPAFSQIREDAPDKQKLIDQLVVLFGSLLFLIVGVGIGTAQIYVRLLFGPAWTTSSPLLKIYLLVVITLAFSALIRDILRAHRLTGAYLRVQFGIVAVNLILALILIPHGIKPFLFGVVAMSCVSVVAYAKLMARRTGIRIWTSLPLLWPTLVATVSMALSLLLVQKMQYSRTGDLLLFLACAGLAIGVYVAVFLSIQFNQARALWEMTKNRLA